MFPGNLEMQDLGWEAFVSNQEDALFKR